MVPPPFRASLKAKGKENKDKAAKPDALTESKEAMLDLQARLRGSKDSSSATYTGGAGSGDSERAAKRIDAELKESIKKIIRLEKEVSDSQEIIVRLRNYKSAAAIDTTIADLESELLAVKLELEKTRVELAESQKELKKVKEELEISAAVTESTETGLLELAKEYDSKENSKNEGFIGKLENEIAGLNARLESQELRMEEIQFEFEEIHALLDTTGSSEESASAKVENLLAALKDEKTAGVESLKNFKAAEKKYQLRIQALFAETEKLKHIRVTPPVASQSPTPAEHKLQSQVTILEGRLATQFKSTASFSTLLTNERRRVSQLETMLRTRDQEKERKDLDRDRRDQERDRNDVIRDRRDQERDYNDSERDRRDQARDEREQLAHSKLEYSAVQTQTEQTTILEAQLALAAQKKSLEMTSSVLATEISQQKLVRSTFEGDRAGLEQERITFAGVKEELNTLRKSLDREILSQKQERAILVAERNALESEKMELEEREKKTLSISQSFSNFSESGKASVPTSVGNQDKEIANLKTTISKLATLIKKLNLTISTLQSENTNLLLESVVDC